MCKIKLILITLLSSMLIFSSCGKWSSEEAATSAMSEESSGIVEILRGKIEISKNEDIDNESSYLLTMPDYGTILKGFDGNGDIEQFIISGIDGDDYPVITVEIQGTDDQTLNLDSPEVRAALEKELTKEINELIEAESREED